MHGMDGAEYKSTTSAMPYSLGHTILGQGVTLGRTNPEVEGIELGECGSRHTTVHSQGCEDRIASLHRAVRFHDFDGLDGSDRGTALRRVDFHALEEAGIECGVLIRQRG